MLICSIAYLCSFKVTLKNLLPWKIKWNCADYTWCGLRLKGFVEQYSLWSSERKLHQCRSAQSHDLLLFSSSFASVAHSKAWLALPSLARLALKLAFGLTYQEKVASLAKVATLWPLKAGFPGHVSLNGRAKAIMGHNLAYLVLLVVILRILIYNRKL